MRITCGRGEYDLYIGHFEFESTTNLLDLENAFWVYQFLIRGPYGTYDVTRGTHMVVSTMSTPAAVLRMLYPSSAQLLAGPVVPSLPWARSVLTPWYYRTPHVGAKNTFSALYCRNYLPAMLRDLEDYMFTSYLQVVDAALQRPVVFQNSARHCRRHGMRYNAAGTVFGAGVRRKYVIKPYAEKLVTKLALEATERYAIAASLASGNKWVPS